MVPDGRYVVYRTQFAANDQLSKVSIDHFYCGPSTAAVPKPGHTRVGLDPDNDLPEMGSP